MSNQIFKKSVPHKILYDLLDKEAIKTHKYYLLNKIVFKKCEYNNLLEKWCQNLKPHYYLSKQYYLTRKLTYSRFINLLKPSMGLFVTTPPKSNIIVFIDIIAFSKLLF